MTIGYEKPATPPIASAPIITEMGQERGATNANREMQTGHETARDLYEAARLLLDIAGDGQEHIAMNTNPDILKKYVTVHRTPTLADMQKHLQGSKTLGATLQHQDGTTRALCFDADDPHTWQRLQDGAISLAGLGYKPLLEPSPAQRGGHLWLIFSERVNADAARSQVVTTAPALGKIGEYWPSRGNQKVRLPAGKYVTPTFSQWTHLVGAETGTETPTILNIFLANLTPAELIPAAAPADEQELTDAAQPERRTKQPSQRVATQAPDAHHRQKYGNHSMWWVQWPNEQYLIDRFNARYTIDDLATYERNGMINAGQIGRPERTASVGVTPDGQRFTDFGAGARQPDGTPGGGDPFEFYVRSQNRDKSDVLRELGRALNSEASRELLRAARAGEPPPAWVTDILTDTGREIYNQNAQRNGHPPLNETRGVVGFSMLHDTERPQEQAESKTAYMDAARLILSGSSELWQGEQQAETQVIPEYEGDYPPPQRPCFHCKVVAWQWSGEQYVCSHPGHPLA